jgi:thiamine-phosphate pyrophosphorylase
VDHAVDLDRARLSGARLQLLFTPALVPAGIEPLAVLEAALPHVDVIQVRIKDEESASAPSPARELWEWTRRVLELAGDVPVLVNDRVDVAKALLEEGCAGVHLGQDDQDPEAVRAVLGPDAWIGLSTHNPRQVVRANEMPIDYLGFGPVFATTTKDYTRGLGPELAWIAKEASSRPVFAIGGITLENATELDRVGRVAVSSAILGADNPGTMAAGLRSALEL